MRSYAITLPAIEHYADALAQFEHLLGRLAREESQRLTHGELEAMVQAEGSERLRRLIQGHLDQRRVEEPIREYVVGEDGIATHRREGCKRSLETRFGEGIVPRLGSGGRTLDSVFPLDAQLNLPPDKYSHGRRERLVEEVVGGSFDKAVEHLARAGGGRMAKRQAEEVAVYLSQDFDAFSAQPLAPPQAGGEEGNLLVISADGKGLVMHPKGLREATRRALEREEHKQHTRLSPGEKKNRKRMATVVSVYELAPYPRTPEQILDPDQQPKGKRPRAQNKRTWARVEADQGTVIEQAFEEAVRRDPHQKMRWVVLPDGQEDLLRQVSAAAKRYKVEIVLVQDFVHVLEYLMERRLCTTPPERRRTRGLGEGSGKRHTPGPGPGRGGRSASCCHPQAAEPERAQTRRQSRRLHRQQPGTTPVRSRPGARTADRHRHHRRGVPASGQGPEGYHRSALGLGAGRGHPQAALPEGQRRLAGLLGLSLRARAATQLPGPADPSA